MSIDYLNNPRLQVQKETIYSIVKLQHEVESLFPWKVALDDSEIVISSDTVKLITKYIKQLKGKG